MAIIPLKTKTNPNVRGMLTGLLPNKTTNSSVISLDSFFGGLKNPSTKVKKPVSIEEQVFPKSGNLLQRAGNAVGRSALTFLQPVGERFGSAIRSAQTGSLTPIKESFAEQNRQFGPRMENESGEDYLKRLTNIALIASVDAPRINPKKPKKVDLLNNQYSIKSKKVVEAFDNSKNQKNISTFNNTNFELGDMGRNHEVRKLKELRVDRFPATELPNTIANIKNTYKAGNNPVSYRFDNKVHVAEMLNGEKRAIVTRKNKNGAEEIISWHKIDETKNPKYLSTLESYGSSAGVRTQIDDLEGRSPVQLKDRTNPSITQDLSTVKLQEEARKYKSAEELGINTKEGGHLLDSLKGQVVTAKIDSSRLSTDIGLDIRDLTKQTTGKLTSDYWLKKIKNGERPPILVGLEDGKLKVIDGNHRATAYVQEGVKDVPVIYTNEAKSQLTDIWNEANKPKASNLDTNGKPLEVLPNRKLPQSVDPATKGAIYKTQKIEQQTPGDALLTNQKIDPSISLANRTLSSKNSETKIPSTLEQPKLKQVLEKNSLDTPVNKIINALKEAKPLRRKQEALYSAERAKRVAAISNIGKKNTGEQGYYAQLGQLKGGLPKVEFEGIRGKISQSDIDSLFSQVEHSNITPFEKISAKTGLANLLGKDGGRIPTKSELALLSEIFPPEFTKALLQKRSTWQKIKDTGLEVLNVPRSLMASFDLSAPLRQGILMTSKPKQFLPAFRDMFKYAGSEKAYKSMIDDIKSRPNYLKMRESKLALTDNTSPILNLREDQFMSNLAEKIPFIGQLVRASDRAYTGFLNKLRADVFDDLVSKSKALGIEQTPKLTNDIAKFINTSTGRGDLGALNSSAPLLNGIFFSPRLLASRINVLNPAYYVKLEPFARKEALKSLLIFAGVAGTSLTLAKLGGADVGADPRSADFGKIKTGNTRYDILGGFQQYIRLASQLITGEIVSSSSGRTMTLGEGYKPMTRKDIILRFFESKESPVASFISGLLSGKTPLGGDFDIPTEVASRFTPMMAQDLYDLYKEGGLNGMIGGLPTPFGVGTQTYGKTELIEGVNPVGELTTQVRPISGLSETVIEKIFGKQPLKSSKSFDVEQYYDQLLKMPREEAGPIFDEIISTNPELAKQISDVREDRIKGITPKDKDLKAKGVSSGDRAMAIIKELDKLKSKEDKAAKWEEYTFKGIITPEVSNQLMKLLNK